MRKAIKYTFILSLGVLISSMVLFGAPSLKDLKPPKSLPLQSEFYTVDLVQEAKEAGFLGFHVVAPHGSYQVEGFLSLQKLLHEIEVIETVRRDKSGGGFFEGASNSVKETGEGFVNLVAHPVQSVGGVGKAAGKLGRGIGGMFRQKEEGEKTTFGEKVLGGSEREVANELKVDVYTTNPYLKALIQQIAKARMGGKGAVMVVKFFIPVSLLASAVITASGVNSAADRLVNDTDRTELFRLNKNALLALGFQEEDVKTLLSLPYYSPREATYLRFYLEALKTVPGYQEMMNAALHADSEQKARAILYEGQMATRDAEEVPKFKRIQVFNEGLAIEESDKVILVTPYDYLDQSHLGTGVMNRISELKASWSKNSAEIWNGAKATAGFASLALLKGVKVRDWLLIQAAQE